VEINNFLDYFAWKKRSHYFEERKQNPNYLFDLESIQLGEVNSILIKEAIEVMFKEFKNDAEFQKSNNNPDNSNSDDSWETKLSEHYSDMIKRSYDFHFFKNTTLVLLQWFNNKSSQFEQPGIQQQFDKKNRDYKKQLIEKASKQKENFYTIELVNLTQNLYNYNNLQETLLRIIINSVEYGFPLHYLSIKKIGTAFHDFLDEEINHSGIHIKVKGDNDEIVISCKVHHGKAEFEIRKFNKSIFICQSDYRKFIGNNEEIDTNEFIYEAYFSKMKEHFSPFDAETMRKGILKYLRNPKKDNNVFGEE
jgi:hypothetical protein